MHILRIITRLNIGGPAIQAILLSEKIENTLLCYGSLDREEGSILINDELNEKFFSLEKICIPSLQRNINLIDDWKTFWAIRRILKEREIDILHTHMSKAGFLGRLAGISVNLFQKKKIKLVHTFHGHTFHSYFFKMKAFLFIQLERFLGRRSTIVCISPQQRWDLANKYNITTYQTSRLIPLGLELKRFRELLPPIPSYRLNVAIVGRLEPVKNHKMLLKAIKQLDDMNQLNFYRFYIIGKGGEEDFLKGLSDMMGINKAIVWWGWEKDLADFYQGENIHVVVNTSLNEGTPVALIEAIVAGREVICSNFDGAYQFLDQAGWIVSVDNHCELINKLYLMGSSAKLATEEKRNVFYERYSSERLIKDIKKLYEELLDEAPHS